MGDACAPNGLSKGCRVFCSRSMYAQIVVHEADEPDVFVDFLDADALTGKDVREVDAFAMHADASAGGHDDVAIV